MLLSRRVHTSPDEHYPIASLPETVEIDSLWE